MNNTSHPYYNEVKDLVNTIYGNGAEKVRVDTGEGFPYVNSPKEAISEILSVDESAVQFMADGVRVTVWVVLGNSPGELVNDVTPANHRLVGVLDTFSDKWAKKAK